MQLSGFFRSVNENPHYRIFVSMLHLLSSLPGLQNGDKGLPSIFMVSHGISVKMLITLELHGILRSNFVY